MVSKRKKQQVPKVPTTAPSKPTTAEALVAYNAALVEGLFASEVWIEIVFPLLQESIASVSGRFTNGRFHKGTLTRENHELHELKGYQLALEEFHNRLHDFILARDKMRESRITKDKELKAPLYNPFLEEHEENGQD